jgi:hypothetical protein
LKRNRLIGLSLIIIGILGLAVISIQFSPMLLTDQLTTTTSTPYRTPGTYETYPSIAPKNIDEAVDMARGYISSTGYPDLALKEIMEFQYNYYFIAVEKSTGVGAFEGIIEKEVGLSGMGQMMGLIHPEQGPNMMWNTKYGHMSDWDSWGGMMGRGMHGRWGDYQQYSGVPTADMPVTSEDAVQIAQTYLESYLPGATVEHPDTFYGYYTIHVLKDGQVYGMLSVNGYTGQLWYHTWHGAFIQMKELT